MLTISVKGMPAEARHALAAHRQIGVEPSIITGRADVRSALLAEQVGRCAYCERLIRVRGPHEQQDTKIEHFHPQNGDVWTASCASSSGATSAEGSRVAWQNLLLVCTGTGDHGPGRTCDASKGNIDVCAAIINPKRPMQLVATQVRVDHTGRAVSRTGSEAAQQVIDSVLCLNDPALVRARTNVFRAATRQANKIASAARKRNAAAALPRSKVVEVLESIGREAEYGSVYYSLAEAKRA